MRQCIASAAAQSVAAATFRNSHAILPPQALQLARASLGAAATLRFVLQPSLAPGVAAPGPVVLRVVCANCTSDLF